MTMPTMSRPSRRDIELVVVKRKVSRLGGSAAMLESRPALPEVEYSLGPGRVLLIESEFEPCVCNYGARWLARGRLLDTRLRLFRSHLIDIEIVPWSSDRNELRLTPRSTHWHLWGARHIERYSTLAHHAADVIQSDLASSCESSRTTASNSPS